MFGVYVVHLGEVPHVGEVHIHLHDIAERFIRGPQYHREVVQDLFCLSGYAARDQFSRGRILRDLTARVDAIAFSNSG